MTEMIITLSDHALNICQGRYGLIYRLRDAKTLIFINDKPRRFTVVQKVPNTLWYQHICFKTNLDLKFDS